MATARSKALKKEFNFIHGSKENYLGIKKYHPKLKEKEYEENARKQNEAVKESKARFS